MPETLRDLKHISIPMKIEPEYRNAVEFIINHLEIDNYSETIRICVFDIRDWIKGNKVLMSSSKSENLAYLKKVWIDLLKENKNSNREEKKRLHKNFIKDLFLVIEKLEIDNERLTRKYEH